MLLFLSQHLLTISGLIAGAIGGYLYYSTIGCSSGACGITSHPVYSTIYGAALGGLAFNFFQTDKLKQTDMSIEQIIYENRGTIIDVRTPEEFRGGHAKNSINLPLNEVPNRLEELAKFPAPLILCCASGNRSGQAQQFLSRQGIECYNAGPWTTVQFYQSKSEKPNVGNH